MKLFNLCYILRPLIQISTNRADLPRIKGVEDYLSSSKKDTK
jgi:hypothetical protein